MARERRAIYVTNLNGEGNKDQSDSNKMCTGNTVIARTLKTNYTGVVYTTSVYDNLYENKTF